MMNEETLFHLALEKLPHERSAFLDNVCAGDTELRRRVERLLTSHDDPGSFLQEPILPSTGGNPSEATQALEPGVSVPANPGKTLPEQEHALHDDLTFLTPSTRADAIGRIEHYHVLQVIGKGGFGTVLKAFDEKLHRVVAIKVLSPELAASGTARQRFIREARTAAAVTHEHVVTIHAVVEEHRPPYLVMQLIDGQTLQEKLDKVGMLSLREILRIGMQMAEGLAAAHKQGLVHRDIKPANILLENGVERVKITDFGLARAVDDASVTQSGTVAGTPMYMSPEQANGELLDHRSDLFSLGTVLYVMCTGRPPFRATGTMGVLKRVIDDTPRPIREVNPEIPDWLCDIIGKLHAKKPANRYQTAREVAELLGQRLADVQAGREIQRAEIQHAEIQRASHVSGGSETQPPPAHTGGSPRRVWPYVVASGLLVVGILVAAAIYFGRGKEPSPDRPVGGNHPVICDLSIEGQEEIERVIIHLADNKTWTLNAEKPRAVLRSGTYEIEVVGRPGHRVKELHTKSHATGETLSTLQPTTGRFSLTVTNQESVRAFIIMDPATTPITAGWVQLFNGKDLTGWTGDTNVWSWKNDTLIGTKLPGGAIQMHSLRHQATWKDFELKFQASVDNQIGQVAVTVRGKAGMHIGPKKDVGSFSIEWGAAKLTSAMNQADLKKALKADFNDFTIKCVGKRVTASVNGVTTIGQEFADLPAEGPIAFKLFQGTSNTPNLNIRNVEIRKLSPQTEPGWVQLFNGKDLTGWKTHPDQPGDWQVKDGELVGQEKTSHLFSERQDYADFHLRFEAKLKTGNGGVFFRTGFSLPVTPKAGGRVPDGFETNFQPDGQAILPGILKYRGVNVSFGPIRLKRDTWFTEEIIARGGHITVKVNGVTTAEYTDLERVFVKGAFALQMWGPQTEVRFRNIEIKELPPAPPAEWVQLFNGKDLTGWQVNNPKGKDTWKVTDGLLTGQGAEATTLWKVNSESRDFHLRVDARADDGAANGIVFRHAADTGGYEAEVRNAPEFPTGSLWRLKEYHRLAIAPNDVTPKPGEWFILEVIARGSRIQVLVNGKTTADVTDATCPSGKIALKWFGKTGSVQFKKIEIRELPPEPMEWVQLFNGKDLANWIPHPNWRVEDGILIGSGPTGKKNMIADLTTVRNDFADFHLRVEARVLGQESDSGVFVRFNKGKWGNCQADISSRPATQDEHTGSLAVRGISGKGIRDPWIPALPDLAKPGEWFTMDLIVRGKHILCKVNGKFAAEIHNADVHPQGHINLNQEGDKTVVQFKKIEIKELPPEEPKSYGLSFDGVDDHVAINNLRYSGGHPITLEAWVRVPSVPGRQMTIIGNKTGLALGVNKGRWYGGARDMADPVTPAHSYCFSDQPCEPGKWTHLAMVLSGRTGTLYVNGRAQKVQAKLRADHVPSASTFFIGAREAPTSEAHYPFLGDVAAVRISKNAIYDRDFTPEKAFKTDSDTIGVYNFKDGPSSVLKDSSGLERHGDITGAWWINIDDKRPPAGAWASYFNGKDLRGWREHSPGKGNWTVRDGLLIGHDYLHSERLDWGRFHLKMEAKLKGTGEIYYHIHHNDWKGGIQLIPHGRTGLLGGQIRSSIDPNWHPSIKEVAIAKDDWFTLEVISDGPRLLTKTNGVTTADFTLTAEQQKKWYQKGMISIGTGSKGEWTIRKIEIMELPTEEPGWVQLFNRKDTTGWKYHDKHPGDWTVKDGILTSGGKGGNYLYTVRDDYADFHLRAEVQLEKGFSSAIFFRTGFGSTWEDNKMQPGLDGPYTLISRPFDENPTGSLRVTGLPFSHAEKGLVDAKDWFVLEIIAKGNLIESLVNGKPAATLIDKRKKGRFEKGHIALQMLNPDVVVRYRKIEIKELPAKAPAAPVWEVVDLHKDSKVEQQGKNVTFTLPGKLRYMIATEVNRSTDAPRLVQAIDGDFDLYAKLLPLPELPGKPSTGAGAGSIAAGLLLWQDDENFLTLFQTKLAKSEKGMVYVSGAVDGKPYQLDPKFRSQVLADPSKPIYLRVLRRGNVVKGYLSTDGVQWNIVREVTTKFPGKIDVGVCASINQATGAQVEFADLSLTPPSAALAPFDAK